jgi:hypothetical protein
MTVKGKHSNLLQYGNNYSHKSFYSKTPGGSSGPLLDVPLG